MSQAEEASLVMRPSIPPRRTRPVALVHASVLTMRDEHLLPDHTVVVHDGAITALGPSASISIGGADVIDTTGLTVLPGLADMHVHFVDATDAWMFLANGVTRVRNMWGSPDHLAFRNAVRRTEVPGPHIITTSPIVDGLSPMGHPTWPGSAAAADPHRAHTLVETYACRGYDQIKAYSLLRPEVLGALGEAAGDTGLPLVGHCPNGISIENAVKAGMTCIEHLTSIQTGHLRSTPDGHPVPQPKGSSMADSLRLQAELLDLEAIAALAAELAERRIWNCPTLVVNQVVLRQVEEAMSDPNLKYQSAQRLASWDPRADFRRRPLLERWDEIIAAGGEWMDKLFEVTGILHRAGAPVVLGTDTPNPFVNQGFSVHQELRNLTGSGLSAYEAMKAATVNAAHFMGEADRWGNVGVGRSADLVAVRGNPLDDLSVLESPAYVLVNGWVLDAGDLRSLLDQRQAHAAATRSLPEPCLPEADGETVRRAEWIEHVGTALTACACHAHRRLPSGDLEVHEVVEAEARRRRSHFILDPEFRVRTGSVEMSTSFGTEQTEITRTTGAYRVRTRQVDGQEEVHDLKSDAAPPSEKLAPSILPAILARTPQDGSASVRALGVDGGAPGLVDIEVGGEGKPIPGSEGGVWVAVPRLEDPSYLRVKITLDGDLDELSEMTIWGLRRVRAKPD